MGKKDEKEVEEEKSAKVTKKQEKSKQEKSKRGKCKREKSKQEKTEKDKQNPLHRENGLFSNMYYILRNMLKYESRLYWLIPMGVLCAPVMKYLWTFISKFVIDMITNESGGMKLLWLLAGFTVLQITASMLNTYFEGEVWWRYINVRMQMMCDKNVKVMTIDYQNLEDSDVMDCYQKAGNACNNNDQGIEGMMREIVNFLISFAVVLVGLLILSTMNPYVVLLLIALALANFAIRNHINAKTKKTVWDPMATWWRKHYYIQNTTTDFKAAKEVRMYHLRGWLLKKYQDINATRYQAQTMNAKLWSYAAYCGALLWALAQVAVYGWLIYSMFRGILTIGNFSLYLTSSVTFFDYLKMLLDSVSNLLARSREVDDFRSFLSLDGGNIDDYGERVPKLEQYEFTFKDVSFQYPKSERYALKHLNLTIQAGERLAVVGLNGAGKSTMIKLLLRLYEPTEGEILLNGVNVRTYNKRSYYEVFAPVFQEVQLFAFPMAENVSMKAPEETDKKRAENSLKAAGLEGKLNSLPAGVNTELLKVIYDDGIDLSGGEKQKLALARALYKDAPVVVLDEPTAALDALAESRLYQEFDELIGGKTAVYISHRLSSTQFCSNVAMFQDGEMVEYGTHKSLLEQDGAYASMFRIQAQYYVENPESEVAASV